MARSEPLRDPPEPRRRQEGDEKVVLRRREADWAGEERSSDEDTGFAIRRSAVDVAAAALAAHHGVTANHSDDVVTLCGALADRLGLSALQRARVLAAARLHDLGKVAVPRAVLDKPAPLDSTEWTLIRDHTVHGQRILDSVPELSEVGQIVRHSHERWDGAGYPDGLAGSEIPLESRIVFCADAFHAIRCDRPYRVGRSADLALEEVRRHSGSQFDPRVVDALEQEARLLRGSASARLAAMTSTVRSKRLVALLLSLAVSASALAAPGGPLRRGGGEREARASTPAGCADPCVRGSKGDLGPSQGAAPAQAKGSNSGDASESARAGGRQAGAEPAGRPEPFSSVIGEGADRGEPPSTAPAPAPAGGPLGDRHTSAPRVAPDAGGKRPGSGSGRGARARADRSGGRSASRPRGPDPRGAAGLQTQARRALQLRRLGADPPALAEALVSPRAVSR